jgi:hypothetical protein
MILSSPPQFGQCSMSISNTRLRSLAQINRTGRLGCRPMACTRGSRSGEPARSQAVRRASIALSAACRGCPHLCGHLLGPRCSCDRPLRGDEFTAADVADGSVVPVGGRSQRSFGRRRDSSVVWLTGCEAGAVIGGAHSRTTASGQSSRSSAKPERLQSVCGGQPASFRGQFRVDPALSVWLTEAASISSERLSRGGQIVCGHWKNPLPTQ